MYKVLLLIFFILYSAFGHGCNSRKYVKSKSHHHNALNLTEVLSSTYPSDVPQNASNTTEVIQMLFSAFTPTGDVPQNASNTTEVIIISSTITPTSDTPQNASNTTEVIQISTPTSGAPQNAVNKTDVLPKTPTGDAPQNSLNKTEVIPNTKTLTQSFSDPAPPSALNTTEVHNKTAAGYALVTSKSTVLNNNVVLGASIAAALVVAALIAAAVIAFMMRKPTPNMDQQYLVEFLSTDTTAGQNLNPLYAPETQEFVSPLYVDVMT